MQAGTETTGGTTAVMQQVVAAAAASRHVSSGAQDIEREAETLRAAVEQFLIRVRSDSGARRRYERFDRRGTAVTSRTAGRLVARAVLKNLSRSDAAVACDWLIASASGVEMDQPEAGGTGSARAERSGDGELAVVFSAGPTALVTIDGMLNVRMEPRRPA